MVANYYENLDENHQVVVYLIDKSKNKVLYLKKKHGPKRVVGKLLGFGGKIEKEDISNNLLDTLCKTARRELKEEIEKPLQKSFFNEKPNFVYQGRIFVNGFVVYVLKLESKLKIPECVIKDEGKLVYKPINYHRTSPKDFPMGEVEMLDKLYFTNEFFEERY